MKKINLANAGKCDAVLGFEAKPTRRKVFQILKDGTEKHNVRVLKSTMQTDIYELTKQYEDLEDLSTAIIEEDVEIDFEYEGMLVENIKKIYADKDNNILFYVEMMEVIKDKEGKELKRQPLKQKSANISLDDIPIKWSGKFIPKKKAIDKFVFARHYQIRHINGLTYDFLYGMAKELDEKNALMFVGGGAKGNEPLVVTTGGTSYRAFLEGRVEKDLYCLILHLTNLELKEFSK